MYGSSLHAEVLCSAQPSLTKAPTAPSQLLKLQCDAFAANCITELLFAFFWDVVVPQVDRSQGPVDPDGQRTKMFNGK